MHEPGGFERLERGHPPRVVTSRNDGSGLFHAGLRFRAAARLPRDARAPKEHVRQLHVVGAELAPAQGKERFDRVFGRAKVPRHVRDRSGPLQADQGLGRPWALLPDARAKLPDRTLEGLAVSLVEEEVLQLVLQRLPGTAFQVDRAGGSVGRSGRAVGGGRVGGGGERGTRNARSARRRRQAYDGEDRPRHAGQSPLRTRHHEASPPKDTLLPVYVG